MAGVDPPTCYTCRVRGKKDSPAEVWYDKVKHWACLECHLTEKALQKVKGKGAVREILRKCSSCDLGPPSEPERTPCCFCYTCSLFLCGNCIARDACKHNDIHVLKAQKAKDIKAEPEPESSCGTEGSHTNLPTPEKEFAEHTFKIKICLDQSPTNTDKTKEIAKWISAFMNTSGGLILLYSNRPDSDRQRDKWMVGFESVLTNNWIPESLLQSLVRYQYLETEDQLRIYIFVSQSQSLVTFNFQAFGRSATGISPIKDSHRIQEMVNETHTSGRECASQMTALAEGGEFKLNDPIPINYRESETMEFKHCYKGTSEKAELPSFEVKKLKHRLGEYMNYLSAFANTQGGSLVLGVEESAKFPVMRGFAVTQNQEVDEACIIKYLEERLNKCIWHGDPEYRPVMGQDWNVFFHKVREEDVRERKMIEVRITRHSGGMFLQSPLYYVVKEKGELQENTMYKEGKFHLRTDTLDVDSKNKQRFLRKHVDRANTESSEQGVPSTITLNVPLDHSQPDTAPTAAVVEPKIRKSFKESQSEHKSDIKIQSLNMHDCCTHKMMEHIQTFAGDNVWFPSIDHTLKRLPGDACSENLMAFLERKAWNGVATIIDIAQENNIADGFDLPADGSFSLICQVLIIKKHEPPMIVWCIRAKYLREISEQDLDRMVGYALENSRALKRKFLMSTANKQHQPGLFHFDVEVLLISTEGDIRSLWDSVEKQPVNYPDATKDNYYTIACTGLAEVLLRTRDSVKDRYGDVMVEHLTEEQAKILLEKPEHVLVVNGKSGTGKTVIALHLMMEEMKGKSTADDVIYICNTEGLRAFVSPRVSCRVIVLKNTNSLTPSQNDMIGKAKLIIVDDVHAIELDEHWENNTGDLYLTLFTHAKRPNTRVAVFVDQEQDYMRHLPADFEKRLRNLAESLPDMLPEDIKIVTLTERIRNSQEIIRFLQANQNQAKIPGTIECLNERPGDDVIYDYLGSSLEECGKTLNARLEAIGEKYEPRSVAILCDDTEQLNVMKTLLTKRFDKKFQEDNQYPIQHMVMCSLEEFGGLEAEVILFLLPQNFGTGKVKVSWKYVNVISSRARERLELLLPWDPDNDRGEDQEQQEKLNELLELFKLPPLPVEFAKLKQTAERSELWGKELYGICYHGNKLYCVEGRVEEIQAKSRLCVYGVRTEHPALTLLDSVEVELKPPKFRFHCRPRIDPHSQNVYVPCGVSGLTVYRYEDGRLVTVSQLKSVGYTVSVAVNSSDTVFVCDWNDVTKGDSVYLVDVKADTVIKTLKDPGQDPQHPLPGEPWHVAVLGDSVLVSYGPRPPHRLVLYHSDVTHPAQELHIEGLEEEVWAVTTDTHSRFLVTCSEAVFVLDRKGKLLHRIQTDSEDLRDCAIVQSQLWLADLDARIVTMITQ